MIEIDHVVLLPQRDPNQLRALHLYAVSRSRSPGALARNLLLVQHFDGSVIALVCKRYGSKHEPLFDRSRILGAYYPVAPLSRSLFPAQKLQAFGLGLILL